MERFRIVGLRSGSLGGTTLSVGAGFARDVGDTVFLVIPQDTTQTVDLTTNGPGGLDTGAVKPKTSYALWIVGTPAGDRCLASLSFAPGGLAGLPPGTPVRRIGSFATDAGGGILRFRQVGNGSDREVFYNTPESDRVMVLDGKGTTWTAVPFGHLAPVTLQIVRLAIVPGRGGTSLRTESSPEQLYEVAGPASVLDGAALELEYRNSRATGAVDLYVTGYTESL